MSIQKVKGLEGLKGLKGLYEISDRERDLFLAQNAAKLAKYADDPINYSVAAERIYNNQKFKDTFGVAAFNKLNDNTEDSYNYRNNLLKEKIVRAEAAKLSPYDANGIRNNNRGMGANWEKFNELSVDGQLKVMQSDYLMPSEFENNWQKRMKEKSAIERSGTAMTPNQTMAMGAGLSLTRTIASLTAAIHDGNGLSEAMGLFIGGEETAKKISLDENQRIFDKIYNDDADETASNQSPLVAKAYQGLLNLGDKEIVKEFRKIVMPGSYKDTNGMPNLGIPEYASHLDSPEMNGFSIDDMRDVIAKKKVYDATMSSGMAMTALNNDAKRYIKEHQGSFRRAYLFGKDVAISSMSYTADKLNGVGEVYRGIEDALGYKPIVMVDDTNNIIDPNKVKVVTDRQGRMYYQDKGGKFHSVHKEQVDNTALHNMGKNSDGSDIEGPAGYDWLTLNPQYWTRAEQFGTLDSNAQKQYEKIGSSPYKVAYNPNEDSDLWYESFKMMSFGLADGVAQVLPFGIGMMGKALSTANKVGKVARGFGKVLDVTGKALTQSKVGQIAQGLTGAGGIAYAYSRGAFPETLQQNIENMEDRISNKIHNDIYNRYNSDKDYKDAIDKRITSTAAIMKANYIKQIQKDGSMKPADMSAIDKLMHAKAQDTVLAEETRRSTANFKETEEYANMQQRAIDGASDAAFNTYWTEALKYGYVNTLGHRKFLYQNPSGVTRAMDASLKGLKEITTKGGVKRLATEASKFLTTKDKWKQFGKIAASQAWRGAWTNGTDDMQVDAAERINEDSFNKYLDAWENGDAMATTYGFADGLYSYIKGLQNSLGQETTWNAAEVGALGSLVNVTPNFANIVSLMTKQGRHSYRDSFRRSVERNPDTGEPLKNADGSVKYKNYGKFHDPLGQFNFFFQNGVLSNYYGKKQAERDLQSHADYVNNILDSYNDFVDIEQLVASNLAAENLENVGDEKTSKFLRALNAVRTLNNLANNSSDPATMSSVVQNAKNLVDKASQLNLEEGKNPFSDEEVSNLLSQYYAANPGLIHSEYDSLKALYNISQNAQKLKEASEAYENAETEIDKIAKSKGIEIDPQVRTRMALNQALGKHWQERKEKMMSEIGDNSSDEVPTDASTMIATVGGRKNAQDLVKVYNRQQAEMEEDLNNQRAETKKLEEAYQKATTATKEAKEKGDSSAVLHATEAEKKAKGNMEASKQREKLFEDMIVMTINKRAALQGNMDAEHSEINSKKESIANEELARYQEKLNSLKEERKKYLKEDGTPKKIYVDKVAEIDKLIKGYEKNVASRTEQINNYKEKVLTADEIFSLDPVTRARMMREENRDLYSKEQQREIEKLEQRLLVNDGDALQKIQDIGLLTQRINSVQDAYTRMAKNPEAAAYEIENQRMAAAKSAVDLVNQRNAETIVNYISQMSEARIAHPDIDRSTQEQFVYQLLRKYNPNLLNIIDEDNMLPEYAQQVKDAKEWSNIIDDINAIISNSDKSAEEKQNLSDNIDNVLAGTSSREEIMATLEKVVDDVSNPNAASDFDYILSEMEKLDYQRDATVLENRKQRKGREAKQKEQEEAEKKRIAETIRAAAEKEIERKKAEAEKKAKEEATAKDKESTDEFSFKGEEVNLLGDSETEGKDSKDIKEKEEGEKGENTEDKQGTEEHSKENEDSGKNDDTESLEGKSNVTLEGDEIHVRSENLDEQSKDVTSEEKEVSLSGQESTSDVTENNTTGQHNIDVVPTTLSGNAMSEYQPKPLQEDGIIQRKIGAEAHDSRNTYNAWMKAAGVKLQNIIDQELPLILQQNPHAKVKFMAITPQNNATHDYDMRNHLMLVMDYDSGINKGITSIHNDDNGGVIESNGKKYLIIGTAGYGNRNADKLALYDILWSKVGNIGLMVKARKQFFDTHPTERFYVNDTLSTEIVPKSQIPGYIVRQAETDKAPEFRSVSELLEDEARNPHGYTMDTVGWGIQEVSQFMLVGASPDKVMLPRNKFGNLGSAFVLMPASNGKFVPSYLKVLKYREMKDGALRQRVSRLLQDVISIDADKNVGAHKRLEAIIELSKIFYMQSDGDAIITRKTKDEISLVHDGKVFKTFVLDSSFDRNQFLQAFEEMNPRVNITRSVLTDPSLLAEYDEAGALMTDAALFGTAGSSYSIYAVDNNGNMIIPEQPQNETPNVTGNSDFRKDNRRQVIFKHQYYREAEGVYYLNGKAITDEKVIKQLDYNKRVLDEELTPVDTDGVWEYYILSEGEHPEVIKLNRNTKEAREVPEEQSKKIVEDYNKKQVEEAKERSAEQALREAEAKGELNNEQDVDLGTGGLVVDSVTGEMIQEDKASNTKETSTEEESTEDTGNPKEEVAVNTEQKKKDIRHINFDAEEHKSSQKFSDLIKNTKYTFRILGLAKKKWADAPKNPSQLEAFLKEKSIEVDDIGTSEKDIETWINTLENCR
jgi:hypothetical protein